MLKSPINYMGSKRRLLKQLLPLFPSNIDTFYDLFAGGGTVSLNVSANQYVWNDLDVSVTGMFKELSTLTDLQLERFSELILKVASKDEFLKLRKDYNDEKYHDKFSRAVVLFLLISASFNGLPRFNQHYKYNMPWGEKSRLTNDRYLNGKVEKLSIFVKWAHNHNVLFSTKTYQDVIKHSDFKVGDFLYFDPPYTITTATYNDGKRATSWGQQDDIELINTLNQLSKQDVKWGMSNALVSRDNQNQVLVNWLSNHSEYRVYHLNRNYSNSTYHTKPGFTDEVFIVNY